MGFVESEDNGAAAPKEVRTITWPAGTSAEPPPYQQYNVRTDSKDRTPKEGSQQTLGAAGHNRHRPQSRRPTQGVSLMQTLTRNREDFMHNHLFDAVSVANDYDAEGNVRNERVDVTWNKDRVQCGWCQEWFATEDTFFLHKRMLPSGCEKHVACFGPAGNVKHSKRAKHDYCFVSSCTSKYREEEGWTDEEIRKHVKQAHGLLRRES